MISDHRAYVAGLSAKQKTELDAILKTELAAVWLPDPRNEPQLQAYYSDADLMLFGGAAGGGKALALDTEIPTVSGWKTMGEISVGDVLFDEAGRQTTVTATSEVMIGRPCFAVHFSDGSEIIADGEHNWFTTTGLDKGAVRTTAKIAGTLLGNDGRPNHSIVADGKLLYIEDVRPIKPVPVRCIAVDSPNRLYLCGRSMIPTHNSDLICGVALNNHTNSVIFRKQSADLRSIEERLMALVGRDGWNGTTKTLRRARQLIELGHLEKPGSEESWRGRPHDFIGFDEGAQLSKQKVRFVLGWLRSVDPGQRRRSIIASNPPSGGEGEWLIEWFAPWLDERFSNPAQQGELRWCATAPDQEGTTIWLPDSEPIVFTEGTAWRYATADEITREVDGVIRPQTRTFIQSLLRNNPYLANTGYRAQIQQLPEPLRSQLLFGSFTSGRQDHEWQVIPTNWVKAAQARWTPQPPVGAVMTAIGVDVAQGGADRTVIACRYGPWFAPLVERPGVLTPTGSEVAALIVANRRNEATIVIDVGGGYGGGAKMRLGDNQIEAWAFNGASASGQRTKDRQLTFYNKRSEAIWRFREALNPDQDGGSPIALPPDPQVLSDLTAPRWKLTSRGVQIESKEEMRRSDRLGRSPDKGDAIVMAWSEGERALVIAQKRASRKSFTLPTLGGRSDSYEPGTGWLGVR